MNGNKFFFREVLSIMTYDDFWKPGNFKTKTNKSSKFRDFDLEIYSYDVQEYGTYREQISSSSFGVIII